MITILAGFSTAAWMINQVMDDWAENPVITTLDSISAPIRFVQFPTVTVCPDLTNPVDNWGYLEKLLNHVEFSCDAYHKNCNRTQKVRDELVNTIISKVMKKVVSMHINNPASPIWYTTSSWDELQGIWYSVIRAETANHIANKRLSLNDISNGALNSFVKKTSFPHWLNTIANYTEECQICNMPPCNKACEGLMKIATSYLDAAELLLHDHHIPLGLFLTTFANLTGTEIGPVTWSTFDDTHIYSIVEDCLKVSQHEKIMHKYFAELGVALGFEENETLSLFDIPSIMSKLDNEDTIVKEASQVFIHSHCAALKKDPELTNNNKDCYNGIWSQNGIKNYPCKVGQEQDQCCNYWSKQLGHKLKPIMKIMRMAIGRGISHLNLTDFLTPFIEKPSIVRYKMQSISTDDGQIRDLTSYLPFCSYAEPAMLSTDCKLFEPVTTDLGICYAFNNEATLSFLKASLFKESFAEAYASDLHFDHATIIKGQGAGPKNALDFFIDNSRFLKKKKTTKNYMVGISSANQYFEVNAIAKSVRPGHIKIFDVSPVEVSATEALMDIPLSQRKCKLPHESESQLFQKYSQTSCEFECKIKLSADQCSCIPWDIPRPDGDFYWPICDVYGNSCFFSALNKYDAVDNCKCLPDCNGVRFSINEQEFKTNIDDYCSDPNGIGKRLVKDKLESGYDGLLYKYHMFFKLNATNSSILPSSDSDSNNFNEKLKMICKELFMKDIAIVSVRFETKKYIRSIMDKRVTFGDKLAAFGKISCS